jgi:hypothetical protein
MQKTPLELAQEAETKLAGSQKALDAGKRAFTKRWCVENPGVSETDLLEYLTTCEWKEHPTSSESDFLDYLESKLTVQNQHLVEDKKLFILRQQNIHGQGIT